MDNWGADPHVELISSHCYRINYICAIDYNLDETRASVILSFQCVSSAQDEALSVENVEKKTSKLI